MNLKRNIIIVILAIGIYFVLVFCYNRYIKDNNFSYMYVINRDVVRGEKLDAKDLEKIKIYNKLEDCITDINKEGCYNNEYLKGSILLNKMVIPKDEYIESSLDTEIISIKLNSSDDAGSFQIDKGSIVNIFYSAKLIEIKNIYESITKESILSNNLDNAYVTIKLLENVKIINCYDKYGNVSLKDNIIDTILVEVSKEDSIRINNLKNYGKFSISLVK